MPLFWYSLQNLGMGTYVNIVKVLIAGKAIQRSQSHKDVFQYTQNGVVAVVTHIPTQPLPIGTITIPGSESVTSSNTTQRSIPKARIDQPEDAQPPQQITQYVPPLPSIPTYTPGTGTPTPRKTKIDQPADAQPTPQIMQHIPPLPSIPTYTPGTGTPTPRIAKTRKKFKTSHGAVVAAVTHT